LVLERVCEGFPSLLIVPIEAGVGCPPSLSRRLDKLFLRPRAELPHLKRLPSEYIRFNVCPTTRPLEKPAVRTQAVYGL
jgi:predicted TIM-barrel fold metal-dependent hydrolase